MDERANGLVILNDHEFILTSWGGVAYSVSEDGSHQVLVDTREPKIAAGINPYDPNNKVMHMTTDEHNTVIAFRSK